MRVFGERILTTPRLRLHALRPAVLHRQKRTAARERWLVDGAVSDSALYGLLRGDWAGRMPGTTITPSQAPREAA